VLPIDDAFTLPLLYHLNSEPWMNLEAYENPANEMQFKTAAGHQTPCRLPEPDSATPLRRLIRARQSCRGFERQPMPLAVLGDLLQHAYGVNGVIDGIEGGLRYSRPVPSAGALYPLEVYAATQSIDGLADGLYHYRSLDHSLEPLKVEPVVKQLGDLLLGQYFLDTANAALILTGIFERTLNKYGPRGYRYVLYEAGHVAQNASLLAAESGLASICVGGFRDGRLNEYLGLDGRTEAALYVVGLGYPAHSSA
jgi:SagB-type dehydrogenase family enzyme